MFSRSVIINMVSYIQELLQGDSKAIEDTHQLDSDNEDDDVEWMPDPIDADPGMYSQTKS